MSTFPYARLWMDRKRRVILDQHPGREIRGGGAHARFLVWRPAFLSLVLIDAHAENLTILQVTAALYNLTEHNGCLRNPESMTNARAWPVPNRYIGGGNVTPKGAPFVLAILPIEARAIRSTCSWSIDLEKVPLAVLDIAGLVRSYLPNVCSTCLISLGRLCR
jgi:hypothetical protein